MFIQTASFDLGFVRNEVDHTCPEMRIFRYVTHHSGYHKPGGVRSDLNHLVNRILIPEYLFCRGFRQDNFMRTVQQVLHVSFQNRYSEEIEKR